MASLGTVEESALMVRLMAGSGLDLHQQVLLYLIELLSF